jgi:hypothetical protein
MQRVVAYLGQLLIRRHRQEHIGRLHADLEVVEVVLLGDVGVIRVGWLHGSPTYSSSERAMFEVASKNRTGV